MRGADAKSAHSEYKALAAITDPPYNVVLRLGGYKGREQRYSPPTKSV